MPDGEKASRESMREVKKEYEERRKAEKDRAKATEMYWAEQTGRSTRSSGRSSAVLGVTAVVVAGGVVATAVLHLGPFASSASAPAASSSRPSTTATSAPTVTPTPSTIDDTDSGVVPVFGDTPARGWQSGAAAIVMPRGKQVGIFRPAQVADALKKSKAYLVAATIDPSVVFRGKLTPVFATLGSSSVTWLKQVYSHKSKPSTWILLANRFRPGDWRAAAEVRLRGKTVMSQNWGDSLEIYLVWVAAYWVVPAHGGAPHTIAVRREIALRFAGQGPSHVGPAEIGELYSASTTDAVCGAAWPYPDYLEAYVDRSAAPVLSPSPATTTWDPTDPDAPPVDGPGCFTDTSGF